MTRIGIIGASGRMGKTIGQIVHDAPDLTYVGGVDIAESNQFGAPVYEVKNLQAFITEQSPDVMIDFTMASASAANIPVIAKMGINIILGTTGFTKEQQIEIENAIKAGNVAAVISTNFSIGMNIFWNLVREAAGRLKDYDIEVIEAHHRHKKDAPSGTARTILGILHETVGQREEVYGRNGLQERGNEIGIHVIRGGDIIGDHTVSFSKNYETIELSHRAADRAVFAQGAVLAARFVADKKSGIYAMKDVLAL
ncbi:MAG: 4-hydroxy-tetrahydrodipicolinate reductase [Methanomicrobiales archaeon]|jgi:4-hydroxy-tetrahydrodipicolinate reductase|nr:4-hydroxy-tetrahydrodipicolinate reductase [Methanomicrobiales archaeon]